MTELSEAKCSEIISKFLPQEKYRTKFSQQLFMRYSHFEASAVVKIVSLRYMFKRCKFLDENAEAEFAPNIHVLMDIILSEVEAFTCSSVSDGWSSTIKYQVSLVAWPS